MKKFLLMSLLCVLALTGCKDDSEPEIPIDDDYTGLVLNEVCGDDGTTGGAEDWIEIYNTTNMVINLNGVKLIKTDEDGVSETLCTFAEGMVISGKAYLVKAKGVDFTQGISNKKTVTITLEKPSGEMIDKFDKDTEFGTDGQHDTGGSYSRIPDGTGGWTIVAEATKGLANKITEPEESQIDYTVLKLNELNGNDKYIELYNSAAKDLNISGIQIKKDNKDVIYTASQEIIVPAKGFLTLWSEDVSENGEHDASVVFSSGLSADKSLLIELLLSDGTELDVFKNLSASKGEVWNEKDGKYSSKGLGAFARSVDGTGDWYVMEATQGATNSTITQLGQKIEW